MGIDLYLSWDGMTDEDRRAQLVGFRIDAGDVGYLREAYHGGPYATQLLAPEAFAAATSPEHARGCGLDVDHMGAVHVAPATLRRRLPDTCEVVIARARKVYGEELTPDSPEVRAFVDFVELAERLERRGCCPRIFASF